MLGRGALIAVIGFAVAFSVYQIKLNRAVVLNQDNYNKYYSETVVHDAVLSAMNVGINKVWDEDWTNGTLSFVIDNCSTNVVVTPIGPDTVKLKVNAWRYIFDDVLFAGFGQSRRLKDSVVAYFNYDKPASKFFWFTNDEGMVYWVSGDTVWGAIHTNTTIRTSGAPVFYGKVTANNGIDPTPGTPASDAHFYGGWEIGINNSIPTDMTKLVNKAIAGNGGAPTNTKSVYNTETTFEFLADGRVIRTVSGAPADTVLLTDIASTDVIYSTADIRIKGTFNGQLTLYSTGDIWIDDDIVYADNPNVNPNSDDVLGLVASNDIIMTDNAANNSDITIQAAIMAINGSFKAENHGTRPVSGTIDFTGSILQESRGAVGTFSWGTNTILSGFLKKYRYDTRFGVIAPPYYPTIRELQLAAWWE